MSSQHFNEFFEMRMGVDWDGSRETPDRKKLTAFTTSLDADRFTLVTTLNSSAIPGPFRATQLLGIFAPFDNSVWLLCVLGIVVLAMARWVVGVGAGREGDIDYKHGRVSDIIAFPLRAVYDVLMTFLGLEEDVIDTSTTLPSRIIAVAIGLNVFCHTLFYSGSLSAYYVGLNSAQLGAVSSLQDLHTQGGKLCIYESMADAAYPMLAASIPWSSILQFDNYGPMLEKLASGGCEGAIVGKFEFTQFILASNVNFTVCKDPDDHRNLGTCLNRSIPATPFYLNPATCPPGHCQQARRFCGLVPVDDPDVNGITLSWAMPVRADLEEVVGHTCRIFRVRCCINSLSNRLRRAADFLRDCAAAREGKLGPNPELGADIKKPRAMPDAHPALWLHRPRGDLWHLLLLRPLDGADHELRVGFLGPNLQ